MSATERSIHEQFSAWRRLPALPALPEAPLTIVTGCGTSFHLAQAIAALCNRQGRAAIAVPAGDWSRRPDAYLPAGTRSHLIALSRSGETTETGQAIAAARAAGHTVTALTCAQDSTMGRLPEAIVLPTHAEEGVVMTASASVMLLAGLRLAGFATGEATVAAAEALLAATGPKLPGLVHGRGHIVFLGGGALYGIAQEGAIKLQEMSLSFAQAYHPLEYRHGPITLVDQRSLAVAMFEPDAQPEETRIVDDIRDKGGLVLALGGPFEPVGGEPGTAGLVCLPVLQALGECAAQARNLDTSAPRHLNRVVILT